jgi:ATP-binding cassette subfamily B protein
MTSSPERAIEPLPPALSSMWRLCKLGYRHEPRLMLAAFVLSQLAALPDALLALWLMLLGKGVIEHSPGLVRVSAIGLGVSAAATWFLRTISTRVQRRFRDKVTIALESHVARLQASVVTVAHHERPDYLDRLAMLRNQIFVLDHMYMSVFATVGWILRLAVTIALLMSIHPALALLGIFALPTVFTSTWRPAVERAAQEQGAQSQRLARHLFTTATTAPPGKEVRVTGIGKRLIAQRREAWERWYRIVSPVRWTSAAWHTLGWAVFGGAYVASVVFVSSRSGSSAGDVLLVLAAGSRLSAYIGATVGEIGFLRGFWMDGSRRLAWLEDYAASLSASADTAVPDRLRDGIRLDHVSFAYPGTSRLVLDDVSLTLPVGAVVAIVGENGAGKTTLVKLLARLYDPDEGRILLDGRDLRDYDVAELRSNTGVIFQDFVRYHLSAADNIAVGRIEARHDRARIVDAAHRSLADEVIERLPQQYDQVIGKLFRGGIDLSGGEWQKIAIARAYMRDAQVLILDEPTAALDARSEFEVFQRFKELSQDKTAVLISHRFSSVRMADRIVVLADGTVEATGTHDELLRQQGRYAELFELQAAGYR